MYDVKMHLPQQVEYMLMAEREGDLDRFEMAINNIKEMITIKKDKNKQYSNEEISPQVVVNDIDGYEKDRDAAIEEQKKIALKELTSSLDKKTYEEVLLDVNDVEQQRQANINDIMLKYMYNVKTYLLGYMPHVKIEGYG